MNVNERKVSVKKALKTQVFKTDILKEHEDCNMIEVYSLNLRGEDQTVYRVYNDSKNFLLKTTTYFTSDKIIDEKLKMEQRIVDSYKVEDGEEYITNFIKPSKQEKVVDDIFHKTTIESLYEFGKDTLDTKFIGMSMAERINTMKKLLIPMAILELKGVIHGDLKPENILVKNYAYLIADSGVKLDFYNEEGMNSVIDIVMSKMLNEMSAYAPPEVFQGNRSYPTKIDIYNWGMCLYQLVSGLSHEELKQKAKKKRNERGHDEFLASITKLQLANQQVNPELESWVKDALLTSLQFNPEKRTTFTILKEKAGLDVIIQKGEIIQGRKVEREKHNKKVISLGN